LICCAPAFHAVGVEHEQRVVGEVLDQQPELPLALAQRLLRGAPFGDVAGHLGETLELAVGVSDRVDHHVGPEAAAVLAQPPAFGLVAALAPGDLQHPRGQAGSTVLAGVELREMLADDLRRRVAFQPLGAGIPVGHHARRIEHVDRIVDHALDQHSEAPLALAQRVLSGHPLGDVAGDLGVADQLSGVVLHGLDHGIGPELAAVLAHPPAFLLVAAIAADRFKDFLRQAARLVLGREEAREMLAQDLAGGVALDALGAAIPGGDEALGVEHVDCVIRDRCNQPLEAVLAQQWLRLSGRQCHIIEDYLHPARDASASGGGKDTRRLVHHQPVRPCPPPRA
jgi:hypothetical protein